MNNSRSDSGESTSIYETPITSPLNESLVDSTRIDSSLFSPTSLTSPVFDLLDGRQSLDSMATDSTLRPTVRQIGSQGCDHLQTIDASMSESSLWLSQLGRRLSLRQRSQSDPNDSFGKLNGLMAEMDNNVLELIGIEQQMQSISLKCRSLREQIIAKSNVVHSLISELSSDLKPTAQKQTQTDFTDVKCESVTKDRLTSSSYDEMYHKSRFSVTSDTQMSGGTQVSRSDSNAVESIEELPECIKQRFKRLPALVKGYLTRRLMKTEKVMQKIETIRETTQLLSNYHNLPVKKKITPEDINFHKRLIIQLEYSCHELYEIFFSYPKSAQMALISRSRQAILERHYRTGSVLSNSSYLTSNLNCNQTNIELSSATKKAIQRKKSRLNESQSSRSKKVHRK